MIKRLLSRAVPEHEWPVWRLPLAVLAVFALSTAIVYFLFFGPGVRDLQGLSISPTADPARVRVEVGGTLFAVPAHFTRNGQTRRGTELQYAELHALLPDMQPWSEAQAEEFLRTDKTSQLVAITLRAAGRELAEERMFDALYKPYIAGAGAVGDAGLQNFRFVGTSPYAGKEIFRGLNTGPREAREKAPLFLCDLAEHPNPVCESRFDIGTAAQASYLFKRVYLKDWERIDRSIRDMIRNFRTAARTQN